MLKNENTFPGKFNDIYLSHVLCAFLDSVLRCCRPAIVGEFHLWDAPATSCSYIHQNKYPVDIARNIGQDGGRACAYRP